MRAISCVLISLACSYQAFNAKRKNNDIKKLVVFFGISSWVFLITSIVFMVLGL